MLFNKSALTCVVVLYLSLSTCNAAAYNEDGSLFLTGLRVLDCYGTYMENTFEQEYTADTSNTRTTGWADISNQADGNAQRVPNPDSNFDPIGRIVYIDPVVERPCFFSAQMGGGNFEGAANSGQLIAMVVNNTENWAHKKAWNAVGAAVAKVADGAPDSAEYTRVDGEINPKAAGSRKHHMAALAHFVTGGDHNGVDANVANTDGPYNGIAKMCATLIAAQTSGQNEYDEAEAATSLPGDATNVLYAYGTNTNQGGEFGVTDLAMGYVLATESDAATIGNGSAAPLPGLARSTGVCSTLLTSKDADDDNTAYLDPSSIGVVGSGHGNAAAVKISEDGRLYWQGVFSHVHLPHTFGSIAIISNNSAAVNLLDTIPCATATDPGCGARRVNVVMGQFDSISNENGGVYATTGAGMYVPWAEQGDTTNNAEAYLNKYGYAFWIEVMPEITGNDWNKLRAYTGKAAIGEDCSTANCPITVEDYDTHEAWVGVSVENPPLSDVTNEFYAVLSSKNSASAVVQDKPQNIKNWYGGLTKIPAGRCRQGSIASPNVCSFGLWHGHQTVSTGNSMVAICNNAHANYNTNADNIQDTCALVVCMWPNGRCTGGTDVAALADVNDDLDELLGVGTHLAGGAGDPTITISDAKAWVQMNGQGDGNADPLASNADANSLHVYRQESKDIYVEVTPSNQNYPAVFQRAISRNTSVAADSMVTERPADTINWGIQGNIDIKYPATAWYDRSAGTNGTTRCDMDNDTDDSTFNAWHEGFPARAMSGCGTAYTIGTVAERLADPRIHDFSRSNLYMSFGNSYNYNVMHFTHQFDTPETMFTTTKAQKWLMYTQTVNADATFQHTPSGTLVQLTHKPKYARLAEHAYEYLTYTEGDIFITSLQIGNNTASMAVADNKWNTGSNVRTLISDASRSNAADAMKIAEYSFTTAITFGFHLKNDPDTDPLVNDAYVYFVNASMYDEDAPLHNGFAGLMGSCKRPAWASTTAKNKYYASGTNDDEDYKITLSDVTGSDCQGLTKPSTPERCFTSVQSLTANSLLRGKYELWVQNDRDHFFYKQSNSNATFTVQAYLENDNTFIDGSTLRIGGSTKESPYEWEYNNTTIGLKYNKSSDASHQSDQVGFILINSSLIGQYKIPSEVDAREVLYTGGLYNTLIPSGCRFADSSVSAATNVGDGVDIIACVQTYGLGTYKIYLQPLGSEKYIKQNTDFVVKHKSDYAKSDADIVKQAIWRRATLNSDDEKGTGVLLFDETKAGLCDVNAVEGSIYHERHDGALANMDFMQLELTAGSEMKSDDLCYIQIFDADGKETLGPNGSPPSNFMIKKHPWRKDAGNNYVHLAVPCQNGPSGAANLTTDKTTGSTNYHQIPAAVVEQFQVGYQLKLWVRTQNAQWTRQTGSLTMLTLLGFDESATSGRITAIAKPEDATQLEVSSDGSDINYAITSSTTLPSTSDIVQLCVKPNDFGPDSKNHFFRNKTPATTFCFDGAIRPGPQNEHSINFEDSAGVGMPPGTYKVLTNLMDVDDGDASTKELRACKRWATESISLTVEWKRDSSMTTDQVWTGDGVAIDRGGSLVYKSDNIVGTGVGDDQLWATEMKIIDDPVTTPTEQMYKFKLRYPSTLFDDQSYYFYWAMSIDDTCDCSKTPCTDMTTIETKYLTWPNVGKPNCQEHGAGYDTWFPKEGKYQLCVTKNNKLRGWAVKTTQATAKTAITLSINPPPAGATPGPAPSSLPSSSSTVATLFALAAAVLGALIL